MKLSLLFSILIDSGFSKYRHTLEYFVYSITTYDISKLRQIAVQFTVWRSAVSR